MPIFEYRCPACGERQELLVRSASAAQAPQCPACSAAMEKQFSAVAARTKGGGGGAACAPSRGGFS
jgi:putative FmdB family regulatory protein